MSPTTATQTKGIHAMFAVLTDITPNRATVAVCGTNHDDLYDALECDEQRQLVRAGAGWAAGQRVRIDREDFIADPGALLQAVA